MPSDIAYLQTWIGRSETTADDLRPMWVMALSAVLDRDDPPPRPGDVLPPLWHWIFFPPVCRQSDLGPDGHVRRGKFLPPMSLPRRMWAGGTLHFYRPLRIGTTIRRTSRVVDVTEKQGRSGPLVFVRLLHEIADADGTALSETQDLVYYEVPRADQPAAAPIAPPAAPVWRREITPDPVLLFRYSALTFNGHRIHYDRSYATQVEGYSGLVVHGPLIATFLADLVRRHESRPLCAFRFRAVRPLYEGAPVVLCGAPDSRGDRIKLWAQDVNDAVAMDAEALFTTS